jgi:hypothetical protein
MSAERFPSTVHSLAGFRFAVRLSVNANVRPQPADLRHALRLIVFDAPLLLRQTIDGHVSRAAQSEQRLSRCCRREREVLLVEVRRRLTDCRVVPWSVSCRVALDDVDALDGHQLFGDSCVCAVSMP